MSEEALLGQAFVLKDKHDALAASTGQTFNLFEIIGREADEVRTHSAILGELLDPNGSHLQGAVFAQRFLERIGIRGIEVAGARVGCEVAIASDSRADILIETDDACVVIENKIGAVDQPRQLERYHAYAARRRMAKVVYLTLHADEPSKESLGELLPDDVNCISYEEHVVGWLDDCIRVVARVPHIREILAHYQALLRKLTGTSTGELNMELMELLARKQGAKYNFELAPAIVQAMTALSVETEWAFWKTLRKRMLETGDGVCRFADVEGLDSAERIPREVTEKVVRHAHGSGRNRWNYGWTFRVESEAKRSRFKEAGVEILVGVETDDWGWVSYGLIVVKDGPDGKHQLQRSGEGASGLFEAWAERMSGFEEGRWRTEDDWWLAWTYPNEDVDLRKGKPQPWLDTRVMRELREGQCVEPLVADIGRMVDEIENLAD